MADGYSRNRVKRCWPLKCTLPGEKEWYRGRISKNVALSSLCYRRWHKRRKSFFILIDGGFFYADRKSKETDRISNRN